MGTEVGRSLLCSPGIGSSTGPVSVDPSMTVRARASSAIEVCFWQGTPTSSGPHLSSETHAHMLVCAMCLKSRSFLQRAPVSAMTRSCRVLATSNPQVT
jgi:hypothetical protein